MSRKLSSVAVTQIAALIVSAVCFLAGPAIAEQVFQSADILMAFDWKKQPGKAAVVWSYSNESPLSEEDSRIALATFLYARTLVNHEETRLELMQRIEVAARKLKGGSTSFEFKNWYLETGGLRFTLFPWIDTDVGSLKNPKVYSVSLVEIPGRGTGGLLDMAIGLERVLAPSAPIILIQSLVRSLNSEKREILGDLLIGVNDFYRQETVPFQIGSDQSITKGVMAHLGTRSANTLKGFANKADLMSRSKNLAKQLGYIFLASKNCNLPSRMRPDRVAGLFINYMTPDNVQLVMNEYVKGMSELQDQPCARKKLAPMGARLTEKMNAFIIRAESYRRP